MKTIFDITRWACRFFRNAFLLVAVLLAVYTVLGTSFEFPCPAPVASLLLLIAAVLCHFMNRKVHKKALDYVERIKERNKADQKEGAKVRKTKVKKDKKAKTAA